MAVREDVTYLHVCAGGTRLAPLPPMLGMASDAFGADLAFSGPVMMEMLGAGGESQPHLPVCYDFKNGKMWPNRRPGLGVELDTKPLELLAEITEQFRPVPIFHRPDGSFTNW